MSFERVHTAENAPRPKKRDTKESPVKKQKRIVADTSPIRFRLESSSENPVTLVNSELRQREDMKEFKRSVIFKAIEQAVIIGEDLQEREDLIEGTSFRKLELESDSGATACRSYLVCIENLIKILQIKPAKKDYRLKFSKAYKVLY